MVVLGFSAYAFDSMGDPAHGLRTDGAAQQEARLNAFVETDGCRLVLDGKQYYFAGANAYYLWYGDIDCSSPQPNQGCVIPLLDDAVSLELRVIRTWGSSENVNKYGYCFQPYPRSYDEATFAHFDRVIKEASDRGLRLIVALVNNWNHFGGMNRYNIWCGLSTHDEFYTSACTREMYKDYVSYVLNRVNTISGIPYKDDPTILAWELANEPRCRSDTTGATLNAWIEEMSAHVKSIDANHLVTVGVDGGYLDKGDDPYAWWYKGNEGQDYFGNHSWSTIDHAGFHYYRSMDPSIDDMTWFREHIEDGHYVVQKPVVAGEVGSPESNRLEEFSAWYGLMEEFQIDGTVFWMLADDEFATPVNDDGYFVQCPEDTEVCARIRFHAEHMNGIVFQDGFHVGDSSAWSNATSR